ncbi:MAG: helix-turn-helix transcriptional regulator [Cytophagales bacterium]|nr:helix-turn-helix transcriptional regulator [Cytophagales bacterium]MCA6368846.1 helix-turn-helix transcriptional regulator [Cytophagales bacterium]MCA6372078.1 helix-turn-helix transcriptional regulator [Cytophagales bacterium]MCA6378067.1 helix-turn-helix transcriptional regulator [Cytophagales bacterium]MCA6386139.1 helix-turn-helix transcriptional regulator [Cytophagales bacterium]
MKIGQKIRKIREMKGISQEYLATQLNISPQAYGKLEREETKLDFDRIEVIAKLMEIEPLDIVNFDESHVFNNTFNNHAEHQKNFILHNNEQVNPILEKTFQLLQEEIQQLRTTNQLLMQFFEKANSK